MSVNKVGALAEWQSCDPILKLGEIGIETQSDGSVKIKVGDGVTHYSGLEYFKGEKGDPGDKPTVVDNGDGSVTITGANGSVVIHDGDPAVPPQVVDNGDGTYTLTTYNADNTVNSTVTIHDGEKGDRGILSSVCDGKKDSNGDWSFSLFNEDNWTTSDSDKNAAFGKFWNERLYTTYGAPKKGDNFKVREFPNGYPGDESDAVYHYNGSSWDVVYIPSSSGGDLVMVESGGGGGYTRRIVSGSFKQPHEAKAVYQYYFAGDTNRINLATKTSDYFECMGADTQDRGIYINMPTHKHIQFNMTMATGSTQATKSSPVLLRSTDGENATNGYWKFISLNGGIRLQHSYTNEYVDFNSGDAFTGVFVVIRDNDLYVREFSQTSWTIKSIGGEVERIDVALYSVNTSTFFGFFYTLDNPFRVSIPVATFDKDATKLNRSAKNDNVCLFLTDVFRTQYETQNMTNYDVFVFVRTFDSIRYAASNVYTWDGVEFKQTERKVDGEIFLYTSYERGRQLNVSIPYGFRTNGRSFDSIEIECTIALFTRSVITSFGKHADIYAGDVFVGYQMNNGG